MKSINIPYKMFGGQLWLDLGSVTGDSGLIRSVKIQKRKKPVPDHDGHHCDEATLKGSIRYHPKRIDLNNFKF